MSLTPAFAPDAKSQWQDLEPVLQELVLDVLDEIAVNPPTMPQGTLQRDAVHDSAAARHYLFMRFAIDQRRVTLLGLYDHIVHKHSAD